MSAELLTTDLLDAVSGEAKASPRQRKNYNFHLTNEDPCHRLMNAIEPGTYIPPHAHEDKDEAIIMLRGTMGLIFFDDAGHVTAQNVLSVGGECVGVNISRKQIHSLVSLASGTVFFESKAGPYRALLDSEKPTFAPAEGSDEAEALLARMRALFE